MLVITRELIKLVPDELLNFLEDLNIVLSDKGYGTTCPASASSTSHSMHVILTVSRNIVVDHHIYGWDIQSTRGHISSNQNALLTSLELIECVKSLMLRHFTVNINSFEVQESEHEGDFERVVAGRRKDNRLLA